MSGQSVLTHQELLDTTAGTQQLPSTLPAVSFIQVQCQSISKDLLIGPTKSLSWTSESSPVWFWSEIQGRYKTMIPISSFVYCHGVILFHCKSPSWHMQGNTTDHATIVYISDSMRQGVTICCPEIIVSECSEFTLTTPMHMASDPVIQNSSKYSSGPEAVTSWSARSNVLLILSVPTVTARTHRKL